MSLHACNFTALSLFSSSLPYDCHQHKQRPTLSSSRLSSTVDSASPRYSRAASDTDSSNASRLAWSTESVLSMLPRRRPLERDLQGRPGRAAS